MNAIAREVAAAIRSASAEVGTGAAATAIILRKDGANEDVYPPVQGEWVQFSCDVILSGYVQEDREAGSNVRAGDVEVMMAPDAETTPRVGDRLQVAGRVYSVVNIEDYRPGGVTLYFNVQAREIGQVQEGPAGGPGFDSGFDGGFA